MMRRGNKLRLVKFSKPGCKPEYAVVKHAEWATASNHEVEEAIQNYLEKGYSVESLDVEDWS